MAQQEIPDDPLQKEELLKKINKLLTATHIPKEVVKISVQFFSQLPTLEMIAVIESLEPTF